MKKKEELSLGGSVVVTIIFAVLALLSYNSDAGTLTVIPIAGIVIGVVMCIMAAIEQSKKSAREEEQNNFSDNWYMIASMEMKILCSISIISRRQ